MTDLQRAALNDAMDELNVSKAHLSDAVVRFHGAGLHTLGDFCDRILKMVETLKDMSRSEVGDRSS